LKKKVKIEKEIGQSEESGLKKGGVILITADQIGMGNEELGKVLMKSFLFTLSETNLKPETIMFMNSGVKLTVEGSPVLESLDKLEKEGVNILVCGTCLNYFELKDKLKKGKISNMYEIVEQMLKSGQLIIP